MSCWCSCWPHRSTVGATAPASSPTLAMRPFTVTRERPSAPTRRVATSSASSPSPASSREATPKKRPDTTSASSPSRTDPLSARSPMSSFNAERSAVLPAPVSPVSTVRPRAGSSVALRINARFSTWISSIIAHLLLLGFRNHSVYQQPSFGESRFVAVRHGWNAAFRLGAVDADGVAQEFRRTGRDGLVVRLEALVGHIGLRQATVRLLGIRAVLPEGA